jgi:HK97 family phage portal protein
MAIDLSRPLTITKRNSASFEAPIEAQKNGLIPFEMPQGFDANFLGWSSLRGYRTTEAGIRVTVEKALEQPTYHAILRRISSDIASSPLNLYERDPVTGVVKRIFKHNSLKVLRRPNARQTGHELVEHLVFNALAHGDGSAAVIFKGLLPDEVIPLFADLTRVIEDQRNGNLSYITNSKMLIGKRTLRRQNANQLRAYAGQDNTIQKWLTNDPASQIKELLPEEIITLRYMSINNGMYGTSLTTCLSETIGLALAYMEMLSRLVGNGAMFQAIMSVPGRISDEQAEESQKRWRDVQGGLRNTGKIPVVGNGAKIEKLSMTPAEQQLVETIRELELAIARGAGCPASLVNLPSDVKYSSVEDDFRSYVLKTLKPLGKQLAFIFDDILLTLEEQETMFFGFDFRDLMTPQEKDRADIGIQFMNNGIITPGYLAQQFDFPADFDGADQRRIPFNTGIMGDPNSKDLQLKDPKGDITSIVQDPNKEKPESFDATPGDVIE